MRKRLSVWTDRQRDSTAHSEWASVGVYDIYFALKA